MVTTLTVLWRITAGINRLAILSTCLQPEGPLYLSRDYEYVYSLRGETGSIS